ncbi:MAG: nicotinate-nucleotide adenylyltransferase [Xenococcaceae cyanobacterium]
MKKIALFGTSADPPTAGHQTILAWLSAHYDRVLVWASDNPFKEHQTSLHHRTAMLGLIIKEIDADRHNLILDEELSDRRSLISVNKARQIWGDEAEFILVIGADLINQIEKWYRAKELLQQVKILILPRTGYSIDPQDLDNLTKLGGKYEIATLNVGQVSSSAYRLEGNKQVLTSSVKSYIAQHNLYS